MAFICYKLQSCEMDEKVKERFQELWFQFILNHPDKPWNWFRLSMNPSINLKIVQDNPDKPWDWSGLSSNLSINWKFVQDNPDESKHRFGKPWDWNALSYNKMGYPYTLKIKKLIEITYWNVMEEELIYPSEGKKRKLNKLSAFLLVKHLG